jgi:hypothetical protein
MIGRITPKASNGHQFILVAIDYFTKWVEATSYATVTAGQVKKFIKNYIICRPTNSDNGTNFVAKKIEEYCYQFKIKHHRSFPVLIPMVQWKQQTRMWSASLRKLRKHIEIGTRSSLCFMDIQNPHQDIHKSYTLHTHVWHGGGSIS